MVENLKIALKRQKKFMIIFLVMILLPSIFLSFFGIRAIRNEKFRVQKQKTNENKKIADLLKIQILYQINSVDTVLLNLVQFPSFSEKNYQTIKELLEKYLLNIQLVDQVFIVYKNKEPFFPFFQPVPENLIEKTSSKLTPTEQKRLREAEELEFIRKNYPAAISLYKSLFVQIEDRNFQAQILNNIARNNKKNKDYQNAIKVYLRILKDYSDCRTSSGLALAQIAQMQLIEGYHSLGDSINEIKHALDTYQSILANKWNLNKDQFNAYQTLISEKIATILSENIFIGAEYKSKYEKLERSYQNKKKEWTMVEEITDIVIPEIRDQFLLKQTHIKRPCYYSKRIKDQNYLFSTFLIPDQKRENAIGMLGVKINNEYLENDLIKSLLVDIQPGNQTKLSISDLSGRMVYGKIIPSDDISKVTVFFENNYPPWKIELSYSATFGIINLYKNFYFWTIITLIILLIFGVVLMIRIVTHEREVLKIKSDFVSSVSHEFKTPLTSIKALTERLSEGKVKSQLKMKQYFSIIIQDVNRLNQMVQNILDYSKIEEGKKEFDLKKADVVEWLVQTIDDFREKNSYKAIKINQQIAPNIPSLEMDRYALTGALHNLLDNALKFSPHKKVVDVILMCKKNELILKVKDYGVGISQNELDSIFEKFYQGTNAIRYSVRGTGLGLSLVKKTVEGHGGNISVESVEGQGSTFSLIFPLKFLN